MISHRLAHGVFVDEVTKLGRRGLFLFEQRRAGGAQITSIGKDTAHFGMGCTILAAVALIHQHKDVGVGVADLFLGDGFKLVDDGGDDIGAGLFDQLQQMFA